MIKTPIPFKDFCPLTGWARPCWRKQPPLNAA